MMLYTMIIVLTTGTGVWLEVIPGDLRDLGIGGGIPGRHDELRREDVVPCCAGTLLDQDTIRCLGQNDPVRQSKSFDPFGRQLYTVAWLYRCGLRCAHRSGHDDLVVDHAREVGTGQIKRLDPSSFRSPQPLLSRTMVFVGRVTEEIVDVVSSENSLACI